MPRDTYKYHFKIGNVIVYRGITKRDLRIREREHQNSESRTPYKGKQLDWSNGHIFQIGHKTTHDAASSWARQGGETDDRPQRPPNSRRN